MHLERALALISTFAKPERVDNLCARLDKAWIDEALAATGTATLRKRRLPAEQVVWLVLGMALFRERSIVDCVDKLGLSLPGPSVAPSAIPQARQRLGDQSMRWLFDRSARAWAVPSASKLRYRGMSLFGVDGTTQRVADTDENWQEFGKQSNPQGESAYPLVRIVALMALRSHLLASVVFAPCSTGEVTLAAKLWEGLVDDSLTVVDRGFCNAPTLLGLASSGENRQWLTRAKKNLHHRVVEELDSGDRIVELEVSWQSRHKDARLPRTYLARLIDYQRSGYEPQRLVTSLLDAEKFPAAELVALYHERWEIELGIDEIKTELLDHQPTLRSLTPVGVRQELWGVLLAYNLVRLEMERIADEAKVAPIRVSFVASLRLMRDEWLWSSATRSPGAIPKHLRHLREELKRFILPDRRSNRSYPRAVKIKMSHYARKRPPSRTPLN